MFDTEHSRVILTSHSTSALLRRDTGECHNQLHPRSSTVLLPPKSILATRPKSLGPYPVHRGQCSRIVVLAFGLVLCLIPATWVILVSWAPFDATVTRLYFDQQAKS